MKTIKMIGMRNFLIEITQLSNGKYVVGTEIRGVASVSQPMDDYSLAAMIFEKTLLQLQGH